MKFVKYLMLVGFAALMASCASVKRTSTFAPSSSVLQIEMQDLKCVGETEVSVSYRTYLGFIRKIDTVNGAAYDPTNKTFTTLDGINTQMNSPLNRAYAKVVNQYPEARYFQIVSFKKKSDRLFLATESKCTAIIRAYKFAERKDPVVNVHCNCKK